MGIRRGCLFYAKKETKQDMSEEFVTQGVFDERLKRVDDENNRQNARISKLETIMDSIRDLTVSVERLTTQIEQMQREIRRQGEHLEAIEKEPADNWKAAGKTILTILLTAAVTYLLSRGGI